MKTWFSIQAAAESKKAEISIRGLIGEWGITDRDLIAQVEALGELEELTVRINSRGGEVDHAIGIFNFLRNHPADIIVRVDGVAMSSGSIIAMAGDKIIMPANTVMMIHNPWTFAAGNAKQLRAQAEVLEKFEAVLREVYVARTGKTEEEIKAMMDGEEGADGLYMTAAEAKEYGFADEVEAVEKKGASAMALACALGIPAAVLAKIEGNSGEPGDDDPTAGKGEELSATLADQITAAASAAGMSDHAAVFLLDKSITDEPTTKAAIAQAREIHALCAAAKLPSMAANLIKDKSTIDQARAALFDALAEADQGNRTDQHQRTEKPKATGKAVWAKVIPALSSNRQTKE